MINSINVGYLAGIGYVASTVFSMFCIESLISSFPNRFMILFVACLVSTIFFTIINFRSMKIVLIAGLRSWRLYFISSSLIGVNWICSIFGVIYSNAFLYTLGYFIFSSSLAHLNNYWLIREKTSAVLWLVSWALLLFTFIVNFNFLLGILISIISGATGYLYRKVIIKFSQKEALNASQIISTRFYPLIFLLAFKFKLDDIASISQQQIYIILIFTITSLIIPVFLNQISILKLGAYQSTMLSAFIFPISWLIEQLIKHNLALNINLFIAIIAMIIIIFPIIGKLEFS